MAKTKTPPTDTSLTPLLDDERLVVERLRRHLAYLGLTHTGRTLGELLAWAGRERPAHEFEFDERRDQRVVDHGLELRFRSSQTIVATSDANFGIKGAPATYYF